MVFTSRSARSARTAGTKIALRFPRNVIRYYATAVQQRLQAKLQQMKVVLCCLDGENVVDSREDPGFLAYSY